LLKKKHFFYFLRQHTAWVAERREDASVQATVEDFEVKSVSPAPV
jgi:hypothetical protein